MSREQDRVIAELEAEVERLEKCWDDDLAGCCARMDGLPQDKAKSELWQLGWDEADEEQQLKAENKRLRAAIRRIHAKWKDTRRVCPEDIEELSGSIEAEFEALGKEAE